MAKFKYFSDVGGTTVELTTTNTMGKRQFAEAFPGVKGITYDGFLMRVGRALGEVAWRPITRIIEYKQQPSLHKCNARCLNAKPTGSCECQCGGTNHGAGMFSRLNEPVQECLPV